MNEIATIGSQSLRVWLLEYPSPSQLLSILTFPRDHSIDDRGCAAAQCGKALPFRPTSVISEAPPQTKYLAFSGLSPPAYFHSLSHAALLSCRSCMSSQETHLVIF